ncbi:MAG: hypothetical protein AAFN41_10230, partial [Planctomycetota bacterium]
KGSYRSLDGAYRFRADKIIALIATLIEKRAISDRSALAMLGIKSPRTYREYRNFLEAGGFIERSVSEVAPTARLDTLWSNLLSRNYPEAINELSSVSSFGRFLSLLRVGSPMAPDDARAAGLHRESQSSYALLAELLGGAFVADEGVFGTPVDPRPNKFSDVAIDAYSHLASTDRTGRYVLTGAWLEVLATTHGIHPIHARSRLEEARSAGLLERIVEGSSPATGQRSRPIKILSESRGRLSVEEVDLYDGRFLLTTRAAVRIHIARSSHGT